MTCLLGMTQNDIFVFATVTLLNKVGGKNVKGARETGEKSSHRFPLWAENDEMLSPQTEISSTEKKGEIIAI